MHAAPLPDPAETRDNATFEALLRALSRPGQVHGLPQTGLLPAALALVDLECAVFTDDPALAPTLAGTGARLAEAAVADYLFLSGNPLAAAGRAPVGSALHPENGATLLIAAGLSGGPSLRLTGPGIDGSIRIAPALNPALWSLREARAAYPLGFDLFLVEGAQVIGLPRSTRIEVL